MCGRCEVLLDRQLEIGLVADRRNFVESVLRYWPNRRGGAQRGHVEMKLDKNMKLADLMYGHGSKFMCSLSGRFDPEKYPDAPPIQICEMKCGCWIVADGNNRVGLILKKNPEAAIADIPERLPATARFGQWDAEMMDW